MTNPLVGTWTRRGWLAAFSASGAALIACLVVLVAMPQVADDATWVYWVALATGVLCGISALRLRGQYRFDAVDNATDLFKRDARDLLDDIVDIDD